MKKNQRTFIPGTKWLYLKLYCGVKIADEILVEVIHTTVNKLKKDDFLEKWFFIRYADPEPHLRVRLLLKNEQDVGYVINTFSKQFRKKERENQIHRIQLDTYSRELERYGKNLIENAESIFYIDTECTLKIIKKLFFYNNENYRWMISLIMIDCFLTNFSINLSEKQKIITRMSNNFKMEFGFNEYNLKQFNKKFREQKQTVEGVLNNNISDKNFLSLCLPIKKRSQMLLPLISQIKSNIRKNIELEDLLSSYIHMMINRLFRTRNRVHELIIYDFMHRYYDSKIAQIKYNSR